MRARSVRRGIIIIMIIIIGSRWIKQDIQITEESKTQELNSTTINGHEILVTQIFKLLRNISSLKLDAVAALRSSVWPARAIAVPAAQEHQSLREVNGEARGCAQVELPLARVRHFAALDVSAAVELGQKFICVERLPLKLEPVALTQLDVPILHFTRAAQGLADEVCHATNLRVQLIALDNF